eukprot:960016-Pyramimonas_sp.AAC.1
MAQFLCARLQLVVALRSCFARRRAHSMCARQRHIDRCSGAAWSPFVVRNYHRDDLFNFPRTVSECKWHKRDAAAYKIMVDRCVVSRTLHSQADLTHLQRFMEFSDEFGGYATKEYCPRFNLRRGFRLLEKGQ